MPTGTATCAKHLIHNINALQREHGTLNLEKRDYKKAIRHYDMCKAFNPQY